MVPDRPALTESSIPPEMIRAGVLQLRDHHFGDSLESVVASVYAAMDVVRINEPEGLWPLPA
jgi:hypothetical protein